MKKACFAAFAYLAATLSLCAQLMLPTVFADHMVLQREQPVPVWGTARQGAMVTVEFAGQMKTAVADSSNHWKIIFDPMPASSKPRNMVVSSNSHTPTLQYSDVLVGDVWLCSGQSNMEWDMKRSKNATSAIAGAKHPLIRLYRTPKVFSRTPNDQINAMWTTCTPETVSEFSAVAYYFGKKLHEELGVPVGLLQSAWGGSKIEPWTPPCGFEGFDSLADIRKMIDPMPALDGEPKKERQFPTAIYNGMIHAHIPFAIKGAIWYQGESNHLDMLYVDKTAALLKGWRALWGTDFPFYFVQIAPYQYGKEPPSRLPEFWERQSEIVRTVPNTGMAVVSDYTSLKSIHPPNKEIPGTRLALLALDNTYGKDVVSKGPTFREIKMPPSGGSTIEIIFDSAEGLATRDGKAPDFFEMVGEDGLFKRARAEIKGSSVILSSPDVKHPIAMRFAWHKLATPNLMNAAGLPAPAFRAGDATASRPRMAIEPYFKGGKKAVEMKVHEAVYKATPQGELKLVIYEPASGGKHRPCAVLFYGGGWKGHSLNQFSRHCEFLASHGYVAITPEYRTENGHGTPPRESVVDAKSCIRWVRAHADELGIDPDRLVAGGGSAGGHLAAATATVTEISDPDDDLSVSCVPNCLILFNPVVDNGPGKGAYGYDRVQDYWREFSPMHNVEGKKMPPTAVFLGTNDHTVPMAIGKEFISKVRETGAPAKLFLYKGQEHGFFNYYKGNSPFFYKSLNDMAEFMTETGFLN